jgi:hypothetical protein
METKHNEPTKILNCAQPDCMGKCMETSEARKDAKQTFTPGPWHLTQSDKEGAYYGISANHPTRPGMKFELAAIHEGFNEGEDKANARLIAAAPELLQALKQARLLLEHEGLHQDEAWSVFIGNVLNPAIAKAEGSSLRSEGGR